MRYLTLTFLLCTGFLPLSSAVAQAPFCWECYQVRTFRQILDSFAPEPPDSGFVFKANDRPSRVLAIYAGDKRPLSTVRRNFIRAYYERVFPQQQKVQFDEELLFLEDSLRVWLPVQKQVVPYVARELTPGDRVWLYVVCPGGPLSAKGPDWVLIVNEFQKP